MGPLQIPIADDLVDALAVRVAAILGERETAADEWFNSTDAADYIAAPSSRIFDLVQLGKLEPYREGRRLLFKRSDLDAYVESGGR